MEHVIQINGHDYIMATVAAEVAGVSRQYIMQMIKGRKVKGAIMVSGFWWVPAGWKYARVRAQNNKTEKKGGIN